MTILKALILPGPSFTVFGNFSATIKKKCLVSYLAVLTLFCSLLTLPEFTAAVASSPKSFDLLVLNHAGLFLLSLTIFIPLSYYINAKAAFIVLLCCTGVGIYFSQLFLLVGASYGFAFRIFDDLEVQNDSVS